MTDVMRSWRRLLVGPVLACAVVMVGCGDDDGDDDDVTYPDAGDAGAVQPDGSLPNAMDGGRDAGPGIDGGPDGSQPLIDSSVVAPDAGAYRSGKTVTDQTIVVRLSTTGNDRLQGVAYDPAGNVYAVGYRSMGTTPAADTEFVLAKFLPDGGVDNSFGTSGIASVNVATGGQNLESGRGVVVQPDGKIVIAGDVDHQVLAAGVDGGVLARDKDIALVRFNANGTVDTTFGTAGNGIVRENPGDAIETTSMTDAGVVTSLTGADSFWSLARASDGKLVVHLASRGDEASADGGVRTDTDYTLVRFNENGTRDTTFNGTGVLKTDFAKTNASARTATILPDGKIVGTGYTRSTAITNTSVEAQQPVIYKVNVDGTPDTMFATTDRTGAPGVWHDYARADQKNAEAYTAGLQTDNKLVTIGYGPTPGTGTGTDWVFFRFNADGTQDKSFGVAGATFLDVDGYSDNGRGLAILPDNRIVGVGVGRPKPATPPAMGMPQRDAVIAILGPNGQPDESFAPRGHKVYGLGGDGDEFFNVAVSENGKQAAVVGVKMPTNETENEDSVLILLTTGL